MSLTTSIYQTLKKIVENNKIPVKDIIVNPKEITEQLRYKKVFIYECKIIFKTDKPLVDYFTVIINYFIIRFKVYRVYFNKEENTLNFCLKERNLSVINDLLDD